MVPCVRVSYLPSHGIFTFTLYTFVSGLDVNECDLETDNCHVNADCTDTIGSFQCTCSIGYSGDGVENCTGEVIVESHLHHADQNYLFKTSMSVPWGRSSVILTPTVTTPLVAMIVYVSMDT